MTSWTRTEDLAVDNSGFMTVKEGWTVFGPYTSGRECCIKYLSPRDRAAHPFNIQLRAIVLGLRFRRTHRDLSPSCYNTRPHPALTNGTKDKENKGHRSHVPYGPDW